MISVIIQSLSYAKEVEIDEKRVYFGYRKPSSIYSLNTNTHTHKTKVQFYKRCILKHLLTKS